ncbi:16S rRNA (cytidine(1402)-2'-O)-methyltransferase [Candidatus Gottesmanbacteria bacterium]|nr:16S rRNA (cytidine(1402)-2'-O)-methyltransferase [Candidatus Gottesmanbacteria bacterium]
MGTLFVVSTPIGNLEDITLRAIKMLFTVDTILCEDTRHTGLLLSELQKRYPDWVSKQKPNVMPYYDRIEDRTIPEVIELLIKGRAVALVSDAGTPLVSDPGFRLVRECLKRNIKVESIPGPSAFLAALTSSGVPSDKFLFLGYPPEKQAQRQKLFENIKHIQSFIQSTIIFYCAPHKFITTLEDLKTTLGDVDIAVARELTKLHEEIWKGSVSQAQKYFAVPRGEFVILLRFI